MSEQLTCATCRHIGGMSWDNGCRQDHRCGKEAERRRDAIKPSGDFAEDFMRNFRTFFDASCNQAACRYYEEGQSLSADEIGLLGKFDADGIGRFRFFSPENSAASKHPDRLFKAYHYADKENRGVRAYRLTDLGKFLWRQHVASQGAKP